ncbi:primosomal protein N' [Ferdinandcohnia quinoae]|uniref:Replication restart protein PriA n=1 Tax=Fredinandcohnia quinoae TaxID=2918902 RepID=A0AAW5DT47_9BACI|nr:primosomal protein N' [Fredinandcohnia sp. SECRCQ15]MCH1623835.1 primosomal protein N' [Fredinandcohnia sp. SECRCQ15]
MRVASVIVDVPAMQTDRTFDYLIPEKWKEIIQPGMRVAVPFGPRKVQGFVIKLKNEPEVERLKEIHSLLDLTPVLNEELLQIGYWLTEKTLCFMISALQAMLPAAMRAKYDKEIKLLPTSRLDELEPAVQALMDESTSIQWNEIEKRDLLHVFQKDIKKGFLEVVYHVKNKTNKKTMKQVEPAISSSEIDDVIKTLPVQASKQKEALEYFKTNHAPILIRDLLNILGSTESTIKSLVKKGLLLEKNIEVYRDPYKDKTFQRTVPLPLTNEQEKVISPILASIDDEVHNVYLMYGVTGSGKTEVYMQAIDEVLKRGKEAIVLVPEISLTPQMVNRFKGRFGSQVAVLHSGLGAGEKYDEWRKIHRKEVSVVVGARSAIFAPFENIGIIIIDEEHESSYKQEDNPRYHARDVAIFRGEIHDCPVVLGSATPTLESFARASKNVYELVTLKERVNNRPLPTVEIIDMREELRNGNRSMFSEALYAKLLDRLEKNEQSVLFLNRRGHSSFVMCRDCGYVMNCPHCDISLTYHKSSHQLKCHYCAYETQMPHVCPECNSEHIRFFGTGTQKVEEELAKMIPQARVIRMDVDTTSRKGAHEKLLREFGEGRADILLGTQMIAKGLDFPNVTLVGVLTADTMLHLPDFRSSEKTFQLLTQVSGRAGRHELLGEVVIQTYTPEHYSITLASHHDYDGFYQNEMMIRKLHAYPPFYYLALITVSHPELTRTIDVAEKITTYLRKSLSNKTIILGPVASPIPRINDRYRYQCMIKYKSEQNLNKLLKGILDRYQKEIAQHSLSLSIDLNPYIMM